MSVFAPAIDAGQMGRPQEQTGLRPSEGWSVVALLFLMLLMFARAVDDANWAGIGPDGSSQTAFLNWVVLLGAAYGLAASKSRLSPLGAHLLGAFLATILIFVAVAGAISTAPTLDIRLDDLLASLERFYHDLVVEGVRSRETSAFLLSLGAVGWTTGYFAAFTLFRRRRVLNAVLITGLAILIEVSLTIEAQYSYLVVFAAAALLLIVRMNLLDQREGWARRRIGDAGDVSSMYLRSGIVVVLGALLGSIGLAAYASSAPLGPLWRDADNDLVRLGHEVNRIVGGVTGAARGPGGLFGATQTIRGVWESSTSVVFRSSSSDGQGRYWRAATYDSFDGQSWLQRDRDNGIRIAPGDDLLEPTAELSDSEAGTGRTEVATTVVAIDFGGDILLAPDAPVAVDRTADVYTNGGGPLATIELAEDLRTGDAYTLRALVRVEGEASGGLTENRLAAAGVGYPGWVRRYVAVEEGSIGELTVQTAERIVEALPKDARDPFHIAAAIQDHFYRSGRYRYRTDVRGLCGPSEPLVDCFLRTKVGYCEYFASAMTMMLRTQEIPARMVMGYLPGKRLEDGSWQVDRSAAHAWVEVYFPGFGWVPFDPTPGNRENQQRPTVLEEGAPVPTPAVAATPSFLADDDAVRRADERLGRDRQQTGVAGAANAQGALQSVAVLLALGLAILVLALLYRRRSGGAPAGAEVAYAGVARLAGRFGYGPRPTETAYEYAAALSTLVPAVRDDLHVVASAKVEETYARRPPVGQMLERLRRAYRRVRIWLFALALRRLGRGRVGRDESRRLWLRAGRRPRDREG
ncbi:MAG TPA: transglutaminaseTgpA domain-containing protein [Candidatus Limnocylindrales bacterium]|jgi:hypothetical protein|nr:transglutaminaseTgpA domain-containing protein [Candidatus Limnocylindrales bacterium]